MPRFIAKMETWATTDPFVPAVISEADFRLVVVDGAMELFLPRMEKMSGQTIMCVFAHTFLFH